MRYLILSDIHSNLKPLKPASSVRNRPVTIRFSAAATSSDMARIRSKLSMAFVISTPSRFAEITIASPPVWTNRVRIQPACAACSFLDSVGPSRFLSRVSCQSSRRTLGGRMSTRNLSTARSLTRTITSSPEPTPTKIFGWPTNESRFSDIRISRWSLRTTQPGIRCTPPTYEFDEFTAVQV